MIGMHESSYLPDMHWDDHGTELLTLEKLE